MAGLPGVTFAMLAVGYLCAFPGAGEGTPGAPSLEAQERAFVRACGAGGLDPGPIYVDRLSHPDAASDPRAAFRRMLRDLGTGERERRAGDEPDAVVFVAALEVLGDVVREQWERVLQAEASGLEVRLAVDGPDGAAGRAGGATLEVETALLAAWEQRSPEERRRERAREGMRRRALRGEVLGRSPYGYRIEARRLVPDEREAPVVRRIFDLYLREGEGVRRIARRLNEDGYRTRRGGPWSMVSVRELLKNPVYTGSYRRLGVVVARSHDPLVSAGDFAAVQRRMAARRPRTATQRRRQYLLAGLARCGHCGNRLIGGSRTRGAGASGGVEYYQCQSATNQGRCRYRSQRADDLEALVREQLVEGARRVPVLDPARCEEEDAEARVSRATALRRELDELLERRVRGELTGDQLRRRAAPVVLERLALEDEAAEAARRAAARASGDAAERRNAARARLVAEWDDLEFDERRALLLDAVSEVLVTDGEVRVALAG